MERVAIKIVFFVSFLVLNAFLTSAQTRKLVIPSKSTTYTLQGYITIDSITHFIHLKSGKRISFNSKKIEGSKKVYFRKSVYSIEQVLEKIKLETNLYWIMYKDYYIFQSQSPIQKSETTKRAQVKEKKTLNNRKITPIGIHEKDNKKNISFEPSAALRQDYYPPLRMDSTNEKNIKMDMTVNVMDFKKLEFVLAGNSVMANQDSHPTHVNSDNSVNKSAGKSFNGGILWLNYTRFGKTQALLLDGKLENNPLLVATPGLWAEYNLKNDWIIYGEILPLSQLFYGSKPIFDSLYKSNSNDSSLILNKVNIVKSIHTSFSFGIQKRLAKSLTLGLTAGMNFNHSLLLNRNITFINSGQTLSDSIWAQKPIKNETYPTRKVVMYSSLFVNYKVSKFSFSLGLTLPLTGIILQNKSYPIYPNFLFNLKYTLFGN